MNGRDKSYGVFGIAILIAIGAGTFAVPARAHPIVTVTACDTLSLDPLRVRTSFDISSIGGAGYSVIVIHPFASEIEAAPDFYDCQSPAGWQCIRDDRVDYLIFVPDSSPWAGEPVAGFSITSDRSTPCVVMIFGHVVIGSEYGIQACLRCDMPVPVRHTSWGTVKSRYR